MAEIINFLPYLERKREKECVLRYEIYFDEVEEVWKAEQGNNMWASDSYDELMALLGWDEIANDFDELEDEDLTYYEI